MKLTKMAMACSVALTLAACGGGGSDSTTANNGGSGGDGTTVAATRTLEGVAAKGLIKNGIVSVYTYTAAGIKSSTALVTGRTSSVDGSYSLSLGSNVGLFTVEVTADTATTMADEFQGDIPMPVGMTLRSLIQLDSAATTTVKGYITPFTEMLVSAAASASGGLTAANAASAQVGVVKLLGFDPLTTKPFNANSTEAGAATDASEKLQSIMLAAISKIASDSTNDFGCAGTVSEKIRCVVDSTTGSVALTGGNMTISLKAQTAVRAAAESVTSNTAINKTRLASLDGINGFSQSSVTTGSNDPSPVAAAKSFFASIRTNLNALLNAEKTGALNLQVDAVQADFEAAIAPLDKDLGNWVQMTSRAIDYFKAAKASLSATTSAYQSIRQNGVEIGRCFLYSDAEGTVHAATGAAAINVGCRLSKRAVTSGANAVYTKAITLTPMGDSLSNYTYSARARLEDQSVSPVVVTTIGSAVIGTISYIESAGLTTSITIAGGMPARTDSTGTKITDYETWNINATRTLEADNLTSNFAIAGDITAYKDAASIGTVEISDGSYLRVVMDGNVAASQGTQEANLTLAVTGISSNATGTLSMKDFAANGSGLSYAPTDVKFTGSFTNAGNEFLKGTLTAKIFNYAQYLDAPTSASNFLKGAVSFVGIVKIPQRPDLVVSLAGGVPAYDAGFFTGQFNDGTNLILVSGTRAAPGVVRLSSANGLSMVLSDGANVSDVFKNSSKIATYTRNSGVVNYNDGSFESVK